MITDGRRAQDLGDHSIFVFSSTVQASINTTIAHNRQMYHNEAMTIHNSGASGNFCSSFSIPQQRASARRSQRNKTQRKQPRALHQTSETFSKSGEANSNQPHEHKLAKRHGLHPACGYFIIGLRPQLHGFPLQTCFRHRRIYPGVPLGHFMMHRGTLLRLSCKS